MNVTLPKMAETIPALHFDPFSGPEIVRLVPVTEPQAEVWAACLLGGADASRSYNESVTLRLAGPLDRPALQRALQALVQRHEALRSIFSPDGTLSCVLREQPLALAYEDLAGQPAAAQAPLVAAYVQQEAQYLFDLLGGPLLKAGLLRLAPEQHCLVLTAHHIICDGWSLGILLQDLGKLYSAYCQGYAPNLPAATPFGTYADQQLLFSRSAEYQRVEEFWLAQYQDAVPVLTLPTDAPRPSVRTYQSARADFLLSPALVVGLKKVGIGAGSSFVTTLLAAFEVLLYQLTGQPDLVVGLPAAGQSVTGQPYLVGHCVNLLPLRSQPRGEMSFVDYLRQRKTALFDAYEHQQLTFGSLLKKLRLARDTSRVPLVPVVFNIDLGLADNVAFAGLQYDLLTNPRAYENFELFLNASGSEQALLLEWSYNTTLFKAETIGRMMASLEALLQRIIATPTASLQVLTADEADATTASYDVLNATAQPYPCQKTLHQLITEQAYAAPEHPALRFKGTELSYHELNKKANQLANYLWQQGVLAGDTIGIAVERSPELVLAMLASMKCGATYVPLDPTYPAERLEFMLTDSGATFLLTSTPGALATTASVLPITEALRLAASYSDQEPVALADGDRLLYVLYTSGSTGKPKGVQISHRNVVNFLCSMQQKPGISPGDRLLAITTISFDIAGLELFLPLISGATVVLADAYAAKDGRELLRLAAEEGITLMQATPSSWRMMLDAGWEQPLPLAVLCGGEPLPLELAGRLLAKSQSVWNLYGPTETTIWSSVKQVTASETLITIGHPIANTQFYLLDEHQHPVAPGEVGELCIAGDGVAQGYRNRPALTAEKFIANPFASQPGARLYRTGDLGKLLASGELQCLGRLDHQVKVRGHRIEPGEIEHALTALADVREAVVVAHEPRPGEEQLLAYIVLVHPLPAVQAASLASAWQQALLKQLPAYMVPSAYAVVAAMPLTLNGKVDRSALLRQARMAAVIVPTAAYVPPRTDVEQLVASIWQDHLGSSQVSITDNFFELGGHSLMAVQVMTRLEKETGKRLPLATLFEHPTVEKLAAILQLDSKFITWDSLVPIRPHGTKVPLYIVHGAGLNVLIFNALSANMDPDQPVYGLQAKGLDGVEEPLDTIEAMAAHYVAAIVAANPQGPYALAGYSFGGIIAFEMAKQFLAAGKEVKFLGMFDTYAYQPDNDLSWLRKSVSKTSYAINKWLYFFVLLKNNPQETLKSKVDSLRRMYAELRYSKKANYEHRFGHPYVIGLAQAAAQRRYQLMPQPLQVHLFRNVERIYYIKDFEDFGWKPFAQGGIIHHDIPGNHNYIFAPPHDKESARIIQDALNNC